MAAKVEQLHRPDDLTVRIEQRRLTGGRRKIETERRAVDGVARRGGSAGEIRKQVRAALRHARFRLFHTLQRALHTRTLLRREARSIAERESLRTRGRRLRACASDEERTQRGEEREDRADAKQLRPGPHHSVSSPHASGTARSAAQGRMAWR